MSELYVSPSGDDTWPGTGRQPLASLTRARDLARGTGVGTVVNLLAGTHRLTETFRLTEADSGVTYRAVGEAVISGGRVITGWHERDGVWLAEVGDLDTRQLHVDGRRAERAAIDTIPGNATRTDTGYVTDSTAPQGWGNPGDVEFVLRGVYPWTEARLGVAAVEGDEQSTVITMAQPAFGWAIDLYNSAVPWASIESQGPGLPTRVENGVGFLTEPGTFALDRSRPGRHVLRYRPRPGEDPGRTEVVAPVLEELVNVTGARDVAFLGITFADATWMRPSRPEGFLHYHGTGYYDGGPIEKVSFGEGAWVTVPGESLAIPANVVFEGAGSVSVEDCRFTRLGATALRFSGDSTGILVRGNVFEGVCGGGISISGSRGATVENNWIHDVGLEYSGSPGIAVTASEDTTIAHNQVNDVPHCGIVAGVGRSTRILRNLTFNTLKVLADGGGVYLSGPQGDSHDNGAVIRGNVVRDTLTPYNFALYTDYGAAWVTVEDNAVQRADNTAVLQVWPPLENVVFRGNVWDADPVGWDDPPQGVTLEDNATLTDEKDFEVRTADIAARAGLEPGYAHLLDR
ncbi:right-handed parallel beta-helix repeat-containing protein [Streptosporangium sp. NPDC049304]|uniref:right-handed parallel beta-helix repeat-containing protein n=1 Tax=Streptosporangium sp. NPDC049304 TaxID=3154830 RepID=UPI0034201EA7